MKSRCEHSVLSLLLAALLTPCACSSISTPTMRRVSLGQNKSLEVLRAPDGAIAVTLDQNESQSFIAGALTLKGIVSDVVGGVVDGLGIQAATDQKAIQAGTDQKELKEGTKRVLSDNETAVKTTEILTP